MVLPRTRQLLTVPPRTKNFKLTKPKEDPAPAPISQQALRELAIVRDLKALKERGKLTKLKLLRLGMSPDMISKLEKCGILLATKRPVIEMPNGTKYDPELVDYQVADDFIDKLRNL